MVADQSEYWVDETNSYINSGNGGSGNLIFNEAITVSSGGNLTGVGTINSGAITSSGNINTTAGEFKINGVTVINTSRQLRNIEAIRIQSTEIMDNTRLLKNITGIELAGDNRQIKFLGTAGPFGLEFGDTEANPNFRIYYRTTPNTLTFENNASSAKHTFDLDGDYTAVRDISAGRNLSASGTLGVTGKVTLQSNLELQGGVNDSIDFVGTGSDTVGRKFLYEASDHHYVTNRHTNGDLILMSNNGTGGGETARMTLQAGSGTQDIDITNANLDLNSNNIANVGAFTGNATFNNNLIVQGTSTFNDDVTFTGASANILYDSSTNNLEFQDTAKASFGTGNDLLIYHDSLSIIEDVGTNGLEIRTNGPDIRMIGGSNELMAKFVKDGAVELYHDNVKRLETTSSGVSMTNGLVVEGATTFNDDANFAAALQIGGTTVTSTAAELNKLDGFTGTVADLNYAKDLRATGVTATEFDYLDGVTSNIQTQIDAVQTVTINNNADNRLITGSGTAQTLNGEANLTFDGSMLLVNASTPEFRLSQSGTAKVRLRTSGDNYINTGQNLGIGTSSPSRPLHVKDSDDVVAFFESTDTTAVVHIKDQNTGVSIGSDSSGHGIFAADLDQVGNKNILFKNAGATKATLNTGGSLDTLAGYSVGTTQVIDSSRNIVNVGTISSGAITTTNVMASSPYHHHFDVSGTNVVGGGAGIVLQTSASAGTTGLYGAKIQAVRTASNDGSADLQFYTSDADTASGAHQLALTLDENQNATFAGTISSGTITSSGSFRTTGGNIQVDNGDFVANRTSNEFSFVQSASANASSRGFIFQLAGGGNIAGQFRVNSAIPMRSANGYAVDTTTVIDSSRKLQNVTNTILLDGTLQTTPTQVWAKVKNTNTGTSGYSELHILNDADQALRIGSIGSGYTNTDWAGSRYIYSTAGELRIKAATNLRLYSGGNSHTGDLAVTFDTSQNATFAGTISSGAITSSGTSTFDRVTDNNKKGRYTSISGSSGDWYPILNINDSANGPVIVCMNTYAHSKVTFTASHGYTQSNSASLTVLTTNYNPNSGYANVAGLRIKSNGLVEAKLVWSSGPNVDIDIYTIDANQGAISYPASLATTTDTNNVQDSHEWTETGVTSARKLNALSSYLLGSTEIVDSSRNLKNIASANIGGGTSHFSEKLLVQGLARFAHGSDGLEIAYGTGYSNHGTLRHDDQNFIITMDRTSGTGNINLTPYENVNITTGALEIGGISVISANRNLLNIGTLTNSGTITSTGSDHTFYSGGSTQSLAVGRLANQSIKIEVTDNNNIIQAFQDSDSNGNHYFDLRRDFEGTGSNLFRIRKGTNTQIEVDGDGDLNVADGDLKMNGQVVITNARALTNIGTISSGAITSTALSIETGAPILTLKDTTDDDDHQILFKDNGGTVRYQITSAGDQFNFATDGSRENCF